MIYPDDYKCLICKKRWTYACDHRDIKGMLSCASFVCEVVRVAPVVNLALARCFFGCCPRFLSNKLRNGFI